MSQAQWGNVAEWVGGLGTIGAVLFAGIGVRAATKSTRAAQADRAFDEAMQVTVTVRPGYASFVPALLTTVTNAGRRPIHHVAVVLTSTDFARTVSEEDPFMGAHEFPPLTIVPNEQELVSPPGMMWPPSRDLPLHTLMRFVDSNGITWTITNDKIPRQRRILTKPRWNARFLSTLRRPATAKNGK
jgi:hypothetical protein